MQKNGTILEFPYYYYPGYTVTVDKQGKISKIDTMESENGFLAIEISENIENAKLEVKYEGTTITKISYIVSGVSLIAFISYIIYEKKKKV